MVVKLELPPETLARMDALAPLAARAAVARRLLELGLERAEESGDALRPSGVAPGLPVRSRVR